MMFFNGICGSYYDTSIIQVTKCNLIKHVDKYGYISYDVLLRQ